MNYRPTRWPNVYRRGDILYFAYRDEHRKRVEVRYGEGKPNDASKAQQLAQERADAMRNRIADPRTEAMIGSASRPLSAIVDEYRAHLQAKNDSPAHIKTTISYLERWATGCGMERLTDADPARTVRWLSEQQWSARSRNAARMAILSLCRWAADYGKSAYNPIPPGLVPRANEEADRRRLSRAMDADVAAALFASLLDKHKWLGKSRSFERRCFYLVAANTGLRWREVSRLRWCDIRLAEAIVTVPAGQTKNKKQADLPLIKEVVRALRELLANRSPDPTDTVFRSEPRLRTWLFDLARAGIIRFLNPDGTVMKKLPKRDGRQPLPPMAGYVDDLGRRLDRKCLRMSFCTWLRNAGVDLRDAQKLMRHSDPRLTANTYTDLRMSDLRSAAQRLEKAETPAEDGSRRLKGA